METYRVTMVLVPCAEASLTSFNTHFEDGEEVVIDATCCTPRAADDGATKSKSKTPVTATSCLSDSATSSAFLYFVKVSRDRCFSPRICESQWCAPIMLWHKSHARDLEVEDAGSGAILGDTPFMEAFSRWRRPLTCCNHCVFPPVMFATQIRQWEVTDDPETRLRCLASVKWSWYASFVVNTSAHGSQVRMVCV
jgi:hypothetical protein